MAPYLVGDPARRKMDPSPSADDSGAGASSSSEGKRAAVVEITDGSAAAAGTEVAQLGHRERGSTGWLRMYPTTQSPAAGDNGATTAGAAGTTVAPQTSRRCRRCPGRGLGPPPGHLASSRPPRSRRCRSSRRERRRRKAEDGTDVRLGATFRCG
ncbi:unnamed protein product [Urochloa humidicola]